MKYKKKILIVTANDYLAYQPSVLNLYDHSELFFEATIVSFEPEFIGKQKAEGRQILYLRVPPWLKWTVQKFDFGIQTLFKLLRPIIPFLSHEFLFYNRLQLYYLEMKLHKMDADEYLAVDFPVLYVCQKVFGKCHFLSLEIHSNDPFRNKIKTENIQSVLIQNKERYDFLFPDKKPLVFFIQNAPVFREDMITHYERKDLIWAGSIVKRFAVLECIKFIQVYREYKLILRGGGEAKVLKYINRHYMDLLSSGNIVIHKEYLALGSFIDYLSHFKIGFCFYSWDIIRGSFNYQSAPSGKLFMYLAAGVPVIACNIPGFKFVKEFGAGVLINDYEPDTIYKAVKEIEAEYQKFQLACYEAAKFFSFDKMVKPFIEFLLTEAP
jgi:glycosyltransferase involved in cell wall biosynthesis